MIHARPSLQSLEQHTTHSQNQRCQEHLKQQKQQRALTAWTREESLFWETRLSRQAQVDDLSNLVFILEMRQLDVLSPANLSPIQ